MARRPIDLRQKIKDILTHVEPLPREAATPLRHYRRSGMETCNANKPIAFSIRLPRRKMDDDLTP